MNEDIYSLSRPRGKAKAIGVITHVTGSTLIQDFIAKEKYEKFASNLAETAEKIGITNLDTDILRYQMGDFGMGMWIPAMVSGGISAFSELIKSKTLEKHADNISAALTTAAFTLVEWKQAGNTFGEGFDTKDMIAYALGTTTYLAAAMYADYKPKINMEKIKSIIPKPKLSNSFSIKKCIEGLFKEGKETREL